MALLKAIRTQSSSPALGHYEQGWVAGDLIFTSMQLPLLPDGTGTLDQPIDVQTKQLFENILNTVRAGGGDLDSFVKVTLYVADMSLWEPVNAFYATFFGNNKPARSVIAVKELHKGYPIAMEAIAAVKNS